MLKALAYLLLSFLLFCACVARAQTTNGSITGRVTDPSKATVAAAKVVATNTGTNFHSGAQNSHSFLKSQSWA